MVIVDSKYLFRLAVASPGNFHDSVISQSTDLWNQIKNQEYLPKIGKKVGSHLVPPLILGDAAFPLQPWLMKPCTNASPKLQQSIVLRYLKDGNAAVGSVESYIFYRIDPSTYAF